jgi:hypothetical protein
MLLSNCHKKPIFVEHGGEGTSFYVCKHCHKPCDTLIPPNWNRDEIYDTGNVSKIEAQSCIA